MNAIKQIKRPFNPYKHLLVKVTALLRSEAKLTIEEREANQWQLLIKFCDTQVIVGKGHVNTIFYQFGLGGKRKLAYPDQILERLSKLAAQKHLRYEVVAVNGDTTLYWSLDFIKANVLPEKGMKIYGYYSDKKVLVHKTFQALDGYEWK